MLKVVAICAVALTCHLIVVAGTDIKADDFKKSETFIEKLTTIKPNVDWTDYEDDEQKDNKDDDFMKNETSVGKLKNRQPKAERNTDYEDDEQTKQSACSRPPDIDGFISPILEGEEYSVGTIISYQCKFGYVSRSSSSLLSVCRLDKISGKPEWTNPNVTCIPRSCGDPGYVVNGRRIGNLFTFPNNVTFECLEGYKIRGLQVRYCQVNGEWSGKLPSCIPIRCSVPSKPKNGRVLYSSLDYGTELQYECNKGFMLHKHTPRICTDAEVWSNDEPECIETKCVVPEAPEHGSMQLSDEPKVGTLAFYSCDEGAVLVGASTSKCLSSGDWTFDPPKCLRSCEISVVQDGDLGQYGKKNRFSSRQFIPLQEGDRVKHNEVVILRCKEGYSPGNRTVEREAEVTCNGGRWSEPFYCHAILCMGDPPETKNGSPRVKKRTHGHGIWYECDPGYKRVKDGKVVCKYGKWEGPTPVCADTRCSIQELGYPGLVKPQVDFIQNRETIAIVCDTNYEKSDGKQHISCFNGVWDIKENPCRIKKIEAVSAAEGGKVDLQCDITPPSKDDEVALILWYKDESTTPLYSVDSRRRGLYQAKHAPEQEIAGRAFLDMSTHPTVLKIEKLKVEDAGEYRCRVDFKLSRTRNSFVTLEIIKSCQEEPPVLRNGKPKEYDRLHNSIVDYECNDHYKMIGHLSVYCWHGEWQGQPPACESKTCEEEPPTLQNGKPKAFTRVLGSVVDYECDENYKLVGLSSVFCSFGEWEGEPPMCESETCEEEPPTPSNGKPKEFARVHNSVVDYECDENYEKVGHSSVYCDFGKWQGEPPVCLPTVDDLKAPTVQESKNSNMNAESLNPIRNISLPSQDCFCTYDYDTDLIKASWKEEEIGNDDRIKKGERVSFSCKYPGLYITWKNGLRFFTNMELMCETCQDWQKDDLPECEMYASGDSYIDYDNNLKIMPGGIIEVSKSQRITLKCINPWERPMWNITLAQNTHFQENLVRENGYFANTITINEMDDGHIGRYECFAMNNGLKLRPAVVVLKMAEFSVLCPELRTETTLGSFEIIYTNERKVYSTARYKCKDPLKKIVGPSERKCQENGKWSRSFPSCTDILCPSLDKNNRYLISYTNGRKPNSVASYYCKSNQQRVIGSRTCLHSGEWSGETPTCEEIRCPSLIGNNVFVISYSNRKRPNSIASYDCKDTTQRVIGSSNRTCLISGEWSGTIPVCEDITCEAFQIYNGLSVTYSKGVKVNSVATFSCLNHATLVGNSTARCGYDGAWNRPKPSCENYVTCDQFATLPNLNVFYTNEGRVGSVATFQCVPPTTLIGSSSATCLSTGSWSHSSPICKVPDCSIDTLMQESLPESIYPDMTNIDNEFVSPGSEVRLICGDDLILLGSEKAFCNYQGKWEVSDVQCISACRVIKDESSHLIVEPVKEHYRFGEFLILSCPPGHKLTSEVERMMCMGKTWSDVLPDCTVLTESNISEFTQTTLKSG